MKNNIQFDNAWRRQHLSVSKHIQIKPKTNKCKNKQGPKNKKSKTIKNKVQNKVENKKRSKTRSKKKVQKQKV